MMIRVQLIAVVTLLVMHTVAVLEIIINLFSIYVLIQLLKGQLQKRHKYRHAIHNESRNEQRQDQTRQAM